jgi:Kef-type K+ transport system membrane component KefB
VLSVGTGVCMGFLMHLLIRKRLRENEVLIITLGMAFLVTAVAIVYHLSPLLINMTAGAVLINISPRHHRVFKSLEPLTPPVYALFFVLAGAELRLSSVIQPQVLLFGFVYILVRGISKYGSTLLGAIVSKAPASVRIWLGLSLFPQAGVALGLVLMVQASPASSSMTLQQLALSEMMVNIVLLSVFINQIIGPPVLKHAIIRGNHMEE